MKIQDLIIKLPSGSRHQRPAGRLLMLGLLICLIAVPATAGAKSVLDKNLHYFQPPADGSGIILTYGSEALTWLGMHYGGYLDGTYDHLTVKITGGDKERLVGEQLNANLLYAIGITRYLNLGVAVPGILYRTVNDDFNLEDPPAYAFEDLRVDLKGIILDRRRRCLGLALNVTGSIPVDRRENTFATDNGFGIEPRLILDLGRQWWTAAFNGGYRYNVESKSDFVEMEVLNEVLLNLGAVFRLGQYGQYGQIMADTAWRMTRTIITEFEWREESNYGEAMVAYRYFLGDYSRVALTAGAGVGVLNGAGSPAVRGFIGVTVYEHHLELGN